MKKVLIPFDGSESALRAVQYAATLAKEISGIEFELLTVTDPVELRSHAGSSTDIRRKQEEKGRQLAQPACEVLDNAGATYRLSVRVGAPASEIAQHVHQTGSTGVIMGTRGMGLVASMMIGSVATKVIGLVNVPVTLIK